MKIVVIGGGGRTGESVVDSLRRGDRRVVFEAAGGRLMAAGRATRVRLGPPA